MYLYIISVYQRCPTKFQFLLLNNEMLEIHEKMLRIFQNVEDVFLLCFLRISLLTRTFFTTLRDSGLIDKI